MIVMLFFDKKYFHWAPLLISSFNVYEPECKFCLYTYNLLKGDIEILKSLKNIVFLKNEFIEFDSLHVTIWYYQLICRKGEFLLDTMKRFPGENLYIGMDVDMLVIKELKDLKYQMADKDIGFVWVSVNKVAGGFITLNNTKNARDFMEEFHKRVTAGNLRHKNDQSILAEIYSESKDRIKFLLLTRQYIDHTSSEDSYIWSAHKSIFGSKDSRYKKYIKKIGIMENERQ